MHDGPKKVSIWLGHFENEQQFREYIEEEYNEDGDCTVEFWNEMSIDHLDHDFQEAVFDGKPLTLQSFQGTSWLASYINQIRHLDFGSNNAYILVYFYDYQSKPQNNGRMTFAGSFDFIPD